MTKDNIKVKKSGDMPKFLIYFWDVSKGKLKASGHDVSSKGLSKRHTKHFWQGKIVDVRSGESLMFNSISQMLLFIEERRID